MQPENKHRLFPGQPAGFTTLFFTELWERFSYYGMRAIMVLFLVGEVARGGMGLDDATATAIYGLYGAGVYLLSMPGGWVADRVLGTQRAVLWGGLLIAAGHVVLTLAGATDSLRVFLLGLVVLVLGTGLLKPNVSAMVGQLHGNSTGGRRDAGFTWFYFGINVGAALGPLATAWLAAHFGWHWGFLSAAIGMGFGLWYFLRTRAQLGETGARPATHDGIPQRRDVIIFRGLIVVVAALVVLFATGVLAADAVALRAHAAWVILAVALGYFAWLLFLGGLSASERRGMVVLLVLVAASALFWAGFEQAGTSLTLFAERHTDRMLGSFEFPAGWFQTVPAAFVLVFAPVLAALWSWLAARGRDLPLIIKFALGLLGMGLGFLVMAIAARVISHSLMGAAGGAGPVWLIMTYLIHTLGELCLSPVGMSATTQLAPKRLAGQAMGLWFASMAMGNLLASRLAGSVDANDTQALYGYFFTMFEYGAGGALLLVLLYPWLKAWSRRS